MVSAAADRVITDIDDDDYNNDDDENLSVLQDSATDGIIYILRNRAVLGHQPAGEMIGGWRRRPLLKFTIMPPSSGNITSYNCRVRRAAVASCTSYTVGGRASRSYLTAVT